MTNNMFVPQDVAELLKIRGFDEECVAFYRFGSLFYVSSNEKRVILLLAIFNSSGKL